MTSTSSSHSFSYADICHPNRTYTGIATSKTASGKAQISLFDLVISVSYNIIVQFVESLSIKGVSKRFPEVHIKCLGEKKLVSLASRSSSKKKKLGLWRHNTFISIARFSVATRMQVALYTLCKLANFRLIRLFIMKKRADNSHSRDQNSPV